MGPRNSGMVAGAYGWNLPTEEFIKEYEAGDLRKDVTVLYQGCPAFDGMEYRRSWSGTGYNVRKFLVSKTVSPEYNTNPNNFVVYRYADVLLKKAEALNELGHPDQACRTSEYRPSSCRTGGCTDYLESGNNAGKDYSRTPDGTCF